MNSICVFCGSSEGTSPAYVQAAAELGAAIARRGWSLVYGGSNRGVMGAAANAALREGGRVIGVLPRAMAQMREVAHTGLSELHLVETMHERKRMMSENSDAFVTLPGGIGTMEEFFETLSWFQLGIHRKPGGLLNVEQFYDPLIALFNNMVDAGFVGAPHRDAVIVATTVDDLLDRLAAFRPSQSPRGLLSQWDV
jgi:uncharacterized protein (TIGR00730 family)